jgi:hypothetical protein
MHILWIGSHFFANSITAVSPDVKVTHHNFDKLRIFCWKDLVELAGFVPDVTVVADKSLPPYVLGVEDFPCLTVLYAVDTHIHSWIPFYGQAFDLCLVSLKDHMGEFVTDDLSPDRVLWSPPFAWEEDRPDPLAERLWDCSFVGTVSDVTPMRKRFLERLGGMLPGLHVTRGNYRPILHRTRVPLNYCEHGDLNFRVFETMGCGGCLVTPKVGHGMTELFTDGEHLTCYAPDDAADACAKITHLLERPGLRHEIETAALARIDAGHRASHRARTFLDHLEMLRMRGIADIVANRLAKAAGIRDRHIKRPYLLWAEQTPGQDMKKAYLAAARGTYGLEGNLD